MSELSNEPTLNDQIGTLSGDTPLSDQVGGAAAVGLGEVSFDASGPYAMAPLQTASDPQAKLHIPTLQQNTTMSVKVSGGSQPGAPVAEGDVPESNSPGGLTGFARKFIGTPYVWGGTSPNGFDCSGFVQYVYRHFGVNLPRISADQARAGKRVSFDNLRPGDLVAIDNSSRNNGADHIGIYLGNGLVINAPRPGRSVEIDHLSAFAGGWGVRINFPGSSTAGSGGITGSANKPHVTID